MIEPNTKLTPKEKAISYLENKAKKHESADTYDTVDNSFGEDIDKAIDIAISERTKEIREWLLNNWDYDEEHTSLVEEFDEEFKE